MAQGNQEVCSIRIMFPVESDDQAIEFKKKIAGLLSEVKDSNMQFALSDMPTRPNG